MFCRDMGGVLSRNNVLSINKISLAKEQELMKKLNKKQTEEINIQLYPLYLNNIIVMSKDLADRSIIINFITSLKSKASWIELRP